MEKSELLTKEQEFFINEIDRLTKELSSKQLECIRLKSALAFYANKNHWMPISGNMDRPTVLCAIGKNGSNGYDTAVAILDAEKVL